MRERELQAVRRIVKTGCGSTLNVFLAGESEVFAILGKSGGCAASSMEAVGRLISLCLGNGVAMEAVIKQLEGIRCPSPGLECKSCADAVAKALKGGSDEVS